MTLVVAPTQPAAASARPRCKTVGKRKRRDLAPGGDQRDLAALGTELSPP
jgi:hypothetical protein